MKHSVSTWPFQTIFWIVILSLLSGCKPAKLIPSQTPIANNPIVLPSSTTLPTKTLPPPSLTPISDTATPVPPSPTPIPPTAQPGQQNVQIFLIALEDNGQSGKKIGCDDSVIPVPVTIGPTLGVLRAALEELLTLGDIYYGVTGLYNALGQSELELDRVTISQGKATIHLSGTLMVSGVCDNPRVIAQLEETALQFSTVSQVEIFINGTPLEEVLSLK